MFCHPDLRRAASAILAKMEFLGKYELLRVVEEGEARTLLARDKSSGREVFVHQLSGAGDRSSQMDLLRMVLRYLRGAPGPHSQVLDMGEHEGVLYLVTEVLPGFRSVRAWLESELKQQAAPPPAKEPLPGPDEGTVVDPRLPWPGLGQEEAQRSSSPQKLNDRAEQIPSNQVPGFTLSGPHFPVLDDLRHQAQESTPAVSGARPMPAEVTPKLASEPGEFTAIFNNPDAAILRDGTALSPGSVPAQPASTPPGEFTRVFQSREPDPFNVRPASAQSAEGQPASGDAPAEFARLFGAPQPVGPIPVIGAGAAGSPPKVTEGEFTRIFRGQQPPAGMREVPELSASEGGKNEAGEFTRIFGLSPTPGSTGPHGTSPAGPSTPQPTRAVQDAAPESEIRPEAPRPTAAAEAAPPAIPKFSAPAPLPLPVPKPAFPTKPAVPTQPAPPRLAVTPPSLQAPKMPALKPTPPSSLGLILILGGALLAAVCLVLYFALAR
jgi:hypothetical protein